MGQVGKKKKSYHHGNLREALIGAALELVESKGLRGFSLREAARVAGVAPSAPYRHFEDRSALLTAVAEDALVRLKAHMTLAVEAVPEEQPLERFRAMGIAYVTFAVDNPAHFRVMNDPEFCDPERSEVIRAIDAEGQELMRKAIGTAAEAGHTLALGVEAIELTATTLIYGVARRFVDGHFARMGVGNDRAELITRLVTDVMGMGFVNIAMAPPSTLKQTLEEEHVGDQQP